jgi:hypothetical protein
VLHPEKRPDRRSGPGKRQNIGTSFFAHGIATGDRDLL